MIKGVGVDLIRIERLRLAVERWDARFLKRVYTESELEYCMSKKNPYLSLAVRFAAKEAVIKAIGKGTHVALRDIEVSHTGSGRPIINAKGSLKEYFSSRNVSEAHLSLSHERDYGVACVVLEG